MARVLVIEDNAEVRLAIRATLEVHGYTVNEAADGDDGVKQYTERPHDVVIADINLPNKDGIESLLELRSDFPDLKLIAISGEVEAYLATAREFGAMRTLAKPFAPGKLVELVGEVMKS